jgi:hypothetical protein
MKPPPSHTLANAFTLSVQAEESPEPRFPAVPGLCSERSGRLKLAANFSVDGPAGHIIFRVQKVRRTAKVPGGADNEFDFGEIVAGEPNPKHGKHRKAWVLIRGYGPTRLVRLSVIERDGTSELPLQLVVARDYSTHFCAIRGDRGNLLAVLFATTKQTEAGESIEIRSVSEASLLGARYHLLREALGDLIDRSSTSTP